MSIKAIVISQLEQIRAASSKGHPQKDLPSLTDDLVLLDSGLDSLGVAVLVTAKVFLKDNTKISLPY